MFDSKLPQVGTTIFTVMSQLAQAHQAINLGQGFPDFEGPDALHEGIERHRKLGRNQYAPMAGIAPLRQEIARKINDLYGRSVDPDSEVTVTSGATEALFAAIATVVRAGDEVILLDPCYDCYDPAVRLQGGVPVHVPLLSGSFGLDLDRIAEAITSNTRLIVLNTPHNPCGATLSVEERDGLRALLRGQPIYLIGDEVYEHIIFDGQAHHSLLCDDELYAKSFVISSFGKTYHITGWKIGYCVAPPALTSEFRKIHQYLTFCTFHSAQWALADYMAADTGFHLELGPFYQAKRDLFAAALAQSRFKLLPVGGAYFQLADYSAISSDDDVSFCRKLTMEHGVAAIPISVFYESPPPGQRLVRFCFAKNDQTLLQAAEKLCAI